MSNCRVVGMEKPTVWKDDYGWVCDQATICQTCHAIDFDRLAEDGTWSEAMTAARSARAIPATTDEVPR